MKIVKISALAATLVGLSNVAGAQTSLTGNDLTVNAAVGADISVTSSALNFGTVYRNQGAKTVAATAASAGYWLIGGTPSTTVTATITSEPTNLVSSSDNTKTLPVTFTYAQVSGSGSCTGGSAFASGGTLALDGTGGNGKVCIGGTVTPGVSQAIKADYTGTVVLKVDFP